MTVKTPGNQDESVNTGSTYAIAGTRTPNTMKAAAHRRLSRSDAPGALLLGYQQKDLALDVFGECVVSMTLGHLLKNRDVCRHGITKPTAHLQP